MDQQYYRELETHLWAQGLRSLLENSLVTEFTLHETISSRDHDRRAVRLLDAMTLGTMVLHCLEEVVDDLAGDARRAGASWSTIGRAVGITRQGAHARWATRSSFDAVSTVKPDRESTSETSPSLTGDRISCLPAAIEDRFETRDGNGSFD